MKAYRLKDKDYKSEWELRRALKNISFPHITKENEAKVCEILGVEIVELPDPVYEPSPIELVVKAKRQRDREVENLVVEVNGKAFDGNEVAQSRMTRAIQMMELNRQESVEWVLHDNTVATVTLDDLKQAFAQAVKEQNDLWVKPYIKEEAGV